MGQAAPGVPRVHSRPSPADDFPMRTRTATRIAARAAITPRVLAAALALLAIVLAGATGVLRMDVSGEPPALTAPELG